MIDVSQAALPNPDGAATYRRRLTLFTGRYEDADYHGHDKDDGKDGPDCGERR
ncbi:MAG: hypothetical protein F2763_06880 [Actinobacteria bacterium]|nr:hypothetical protein [Actinomycetota bacterium]